MALLDIYGADGKMTKGNSSNTRVTIDLPSWASDRNIYIMAGSELLAYKLRGQNVLRVKTERCNNCGMCCSGVPVPYFKETEDGYCEYYNKDKTKNKCRLGEHHRPFACCKFDPSIDGGCVEHCVIRYKEYQL